MAYSFYMVSDNWKVQFPIAPSELTIKVNGRNESVDLMNEGEVNLLKSPGLTEVNFTALIPASKINKYPFAANYEPIDTFTNFLNEMLQKKKPFRFVVVRTVGTNLLFDTNLKMAVEGYELKESADNGFDANLDISLKQYREYGTKTVTLTTIKKETNTKPNSSNSSNSSSTADSTQTTAKVETPRETKKSSSKTYTVKKGDCLWKISKKFYGKGSSWKKIYNANKSTIESVAKKHGKKSSSNGHWIYPATKLKIP